MRRRRPERLPLRDDALRLQQRNTVTTYLALYDDELVGYIWLMVDAVVLETKERKTLRSNHADNPVIPALKVARLATSKAFRATNVGLGKMLMRFAVARAYEIADGSGCRLLTLDAYPDAIAFYERLGFLRNKAEPYREREHPSMRFDLFAPTLPDWIRQRDRLRRARSSTMRPCERCESTPGRQRSLKWQRRARAARRWPSTAPATRLKPL